MKHFSFITAPVYFIAIVLAAVIYPGCSGNPVDAPRLDIGKSTDLVTQNISASGGSIIVNRPGDSLDGLRIDVPAGAYSGTRSFHLSYAPISGHRFGDDMTMLTPLITIDNGGGYSDEPMTVTVPVNVPAGHFAMPFLYDASTNRLEALPLIYADSTQVQFITRHFEHSATSALRKGAANGERSAIFISSTDAATLDGTFDSEFRVGTDNFQFVNYGSYIAPKGHCGGQTIAMMWYYSAKKKNGSPALHGLYDNDGINRTPKIWYDDVSAYRFCSIVQNTMNWSSTKYYGDKSWNRDLATYRSIAMAIRETGDPQCLYVGTDSAGHAILAYRTSAGKISVCDPNFPNGEIREIVFKRQLGDFEPYYSGENAAATGTAYFNIHHAANSALVDWGKMATLWKQVLDGTIGKDLYPAVRLRVRNSNNDYVPLEDGVVIPSQTTLDVSADGFDPRFYVFDFSSQLMIANNTRDLKLPKGKHKIGVYYYAPSSFNGGGFIGFKWVNVEVKDEEGSGGCSSSLTIDNASISVKETEYYMYDLNNTLGIQLVWPNPNPKSVTSNTVTLYTFQFNGPGTYDPAPETLVVLEDLGYGYRSGKLTITRFDSRVEGNFNISAETFDGSQKTITVSGSISCER